MKIVRMHRLSAPNDFNIPIILMRLSTTMSRPAMSEKHDTIVISISMTTMLVSSRSSHAKYVELFSRMVDSWYTLSLFCAYNAI